ncbi:unnamed protein product [Alternaria alternata]
MGLLDLPPELLTKVIRLCVDKDNVREVSKQRLNCKTIKYYLDHELFSKMPLLDLPPEIFQRITHILVKKHGITEAWKVRGTSKAFQTYVTYEVLATPSLYAYNKTRAGREILKHKLADFLYTRSTKLNGFVRTHVSNFINRIMYITESWITGDQAISTLRRVICELFVRNCDGALRFVLTDTNKLSIQDKQETMASSGANLIATAAAIGDLDFLRRVAAKDEDLLWNESPAFGYPLDAAVYAQQFGIARAIAQQAVPNRNKDVVDVHLGYQEEYPLNTAIKLAERRHVRSIIEKFLELGADPNGPKYRAHLIRPLHLAIDQCVSGILPLLDAGANPHLINDAVWMKVQRQKYAKTTVIGKALRKALKRYAKSKPAKGVEGFLAEVDEKIKDDTVAVKDVNLVPASFGCTQS